jgi:putative ABC transport system permease protein
MSSSFRMSSFWMLSFWRTSARLAWRDLRGSRARGLFIVAAMAISIASVTAVYGAATFARQRLGRDSRIWLAGDVAVDTSEPIGDQQIAALNQKRREGIEWAVVTWSLTMARSDQFPDPVLIAVKAIDPAVYPFYGATSLTPPRPLADALRADTIVVSDRTLKNLHVNVGDRIRIGANAFVIAGVIAAEPERYNGVFGWGPRGIVSRDAFDHTGIARAGNSQMNRVLLRLPPGADPKDALAWLQALVPEGRVFDYRDAAAPEVSRLELVISFMTIVAFLVLALGAIGVAATVRLNLEQRMETLAIMRLTGARTSQMVSLFVFETAVLMAGGLALGIPLGWGMSAALFSLARSYLVLPASPAWDYAAILQSAIAAAAMMVPLLAGPLNAVWRLKPLVLFRRDAPELRGPLRLAWPLLAGTAAVACVSAAAIAYRMIQAWKPALFLAGALAATTGLAWVLGAAALRGARAVISSRPSGPVVKHALTGLYRYGNRSLIVIVCLALGVMSITGTFEGGSAVVKTVGHSLPYPDANLLIADFDEPHSQSVLRFLRTQPGVESVQMMTQVWLRPAQVNGQPVTGVMYLSRCESGPAGARADRITIADDLASSLGARDGSSLEFETREGTFRAIVGEIRHPSPQERFWLTFVVDCRGLRRSSLIEAAAVRVQDDRLEALVRAVNTQFPTLAAVTTQEIASTIEGVIGDALRLLRMITWAAAAGGLLILIAIVAASDAGRSREMAILSALGATRGKILKIYSLEFAAVGALAAVIGSFLACGFSSVILTMLFYRPEVVIEWRSIAGAVLLAPLLTVGAGWLPLYRLLDQRPMEVLRRE